VRDFLNHPPACSQHENAAIEASHQVVARSVTSEFDIASEVTIDQRVVAFLILVLKRTARCFRHDVQANERRSLAGQSLSA
jgi:hypothetical protein